MAEPHITSSEPEWLALARGYLGQKEFPGPSTNPAIAGFFKRAIGKVLPDETPWCAAFVGSCLAEAGLASSGALTARSYLSYGEALATPRYGCIVVLRRGGRGAPSWQGHVGFFLKREGDRVTVLGGNQRNAVSVADYKAADVLGFRWPTGAHMAAPASPDIRVVQTRLKALGYHEVGAIDGIMGSRTRGALLAFKADNKLPLDEHIDAATLAALSSTTKTRAVAAERMTGRPLVSRIITNARHNIAASALISTSGAVAAAEPYLAQAEHMAGLIGRSAGLARSASTLIVAHWPFILIAGGIAVLAFSCRTIVARLEDHREGKTP